MNSNNTDWRLQGQNEYLFGKTLIYKNYANKTTTDHDHCEFCSDKFSSSIPDCLTEGYTTTDAYHWICQNCFNDFKNEFEWTTIKQ